MAEVIAAAHDADEASDAVAQADALRHNVAVGLSSRELNVDGFVTRLSLSNKVRQREISVGACNEVGAIFVEQVILHALGHTTEDTDDEAHPTSSRREGLGCPLSAQGSKCF